MRTFPLYFNFLPASVHDLTASRFILKRIKQMPTFQIRHTPILIWQRRWKANNNLLLILLTDKKGWKAVLKQKDRAFNHNFNKAVSSIRQPIQSLFNWINELTQIRNASKVRSSNGLNLHRFGKLAAALIILSKS